MDENQKPNENLNEKEKAKEAILPESKMSEDKKKAKSIKTKFKTQAKGKAKKQAKGLKQKLLVGASVLATAIVLVIALVGSYNQIQPQRMGEIARSMTYNKVNPGEEDVSETGGNVEFDAFFLRDLNNDGVAEGIRGTCREVGETDTLYMELKVQTNGRLENGVITINGENFALQTSLPKDQIIRDNTIGNDIKTINLNTVNSGTQRTFTGMVCSGDYSYSSTKTSKIGNDVNNYSKKGKVTLTGTYIPDGQEEGKPITKEVEFDVDWHGYVGAEITHTYQNGNIKTAKDEENNELKLDFTVYTRETKGELILKKSVVEGTIPLLNDQKPKRVECANSNVKFNYDPETRNFTIEKESTLNEDTKIVTDTISRESSYTIKVVYPLEAYKAIGIETVELRIPVKAYYEGYNNTNDEFNELETSNKAQATIILTYENPQGEISIFDITVGKYVYEPNSRYIVSKEKPLKIYNGLSSEEKDDNYIVTWYGYINEADVNKKIVMKETENGKEKVSDQFVKKDGQNDESMEELTSNVGIYFSNPEALLGEAGEIKVFDDELDELLMTFNKDNWNKYNSSSPYYYEKPVKHIRVETSNITGSKARIYVYNVKQLDDEYITTHYDINAFDNFEHIKSTLVAYLGDTLAQTDTTTADYEAPYTIANISLNKTTLSTQVTEKNVEIRIEAEGNENYNQVKWQNGTFLVKLPKDIAEIDINSIKATNNVQIVSYEQYKEGDNYYIKVNTNNNTPTTYEIIMDTNISPNPTATTQEEQIELYYHNANAVDYWEDDKTTDNYDLNGDLNKDETIGKTSALINLVSPNSLLTSETITEYDDDESIVVAPQIANIAKDRETAKINVKISNNYSSTISGIKVLGRIPFIGNKYVISNGILGSEFDAHMQGEIQLPDKLKTIAKVYYSENGDATNNLKGDGNNWQEHPSDFTNIKSYLIDFGNNKINQTDEYEISYIVSIPKEVEYNQVSYSHHAVDFSLDTPEGKYPTQIEPNKVGMMIVRQYDLELTKYKLNGSSTVQGATYLIKEENAEEGKTRVTDKNGTLTLTDLYVDRTYVIKEIKSPINYELNESEVKFKVTEDGGVLKLAEEVTSQGNAESIKLIEPQDGDKYKVQVEVQDEVKASLKIVKVQKGNQSKTLDGIRFKITGKNFENGRNIITNSSGEATLNGLSIGETYTLEEIKANGYYLASPIRVTINNDGDGNYSASVTEDNGQNLVVEKTSTGADVEVPVITLKIENEKIPEYTLKINKVVKGDTKPLEGAKFRLFKGTEKIDDYTTDASGSITIPNLYQYEDSRKIDQTYTLKELLAPDGYAVVKDITFYVTKDAEGSLSMQVEEGKIKEYTVEKETNTVTVTIEDSPSFKLIKKDGETNTPLPNTKFAIYNVDNGTEQLALDSKYNILGEREEINGKTYYTLTTNDKGEIEANLREGLYKAIEVKTSDDKYELTNNEYYFGIGASREAPEGLVPVWATSLGGDYFDKVSSVAGTSDGGYIVGGYFDSDSITVGEYELTSNGGYDGLLIKYNSNNQVELATSFGGKNNDKITSVAQTSDGGYIIGGSFESSSIRVGDCTLNNSTSSYSRSDGLLIKYNSNNQVEWATSLGGDYSDEVSSVAGTSDGGCIVGGYFSSSSSIKVGGYTLINNGEYDGFLIKYSKNREVEWATNIGGERDERVTSVAQTSDGGYIIGGYFRSDSITIGDYELTRKGIEDGLLIKYKPNENLNSLDKYVVEWATNMGNENGNGGLARIGSVLATSDGAFIVKGTFSSIGGVESEIKIGDNIFTVSDSKTISLGIKYKQNENSISPDEYIVEWTTDSFEEGIYGGVLGIISKTKDNCYIVGGIEAETNSYCIRKYENGGKNESESITIKRT